MAAPPPARHRRWLLLPVGALLGGAAAFVAPGTSGCVYHDTCIMVTSPGHDHCRNVALAKMWPIGGSFDDAEPVLRTDGAAPRGCRCYNDAEDQIFDESVPECKLDEFIDDLEQAARQECQSLVPPGYDHNCWTTSGPQASIVEGHYFLGVGNCIGNCEFGSPPIGGSCPTPSPYECATGGGEEGEGCATESDGGTDEGDSGLDETGSDTSGGVLDDIDALVACEGNDCEIDEAFARRLYADPTPLLDQSTRFVYDSVLRRHVLRRVERGSLAHALGLRSGDVLESLDGMVIHDLEMALSAYTRLATANSLVVRVKRGTQWLDFTYTFVP